MSIVATCLRRGQLHLGKVPFRGQCLGHMHEGVEGVGPPLTHCAHCAMSFQLTNIELGLFGWAFIIIFWFVKGLL